MAGGRSMSMVIGLVLMAGACTSSGGGVKPIAAGGPSTTAAISSSTLAPVPTTTAVDAKKAAILAAYRAMWTDSDEVVRHYPINDVDARLENHMAGEALGQFKTFLTGLKFKNQYAIGPPTDTSRAIVKQLVGTVAVVADCDFDGAILMNGRTNQIVKPAGTQRDLVNAKVEIVEGAWKVTLFTNVSVGCVTAS